jgi:hypothetical protein
VHPGHEKPQQNGGFPIGGSGHSGIIWIGIDHQIHHALAVQSDFARAMPCHRTKTHGLKNLTQRLGPVGGVFDELNALNAQAVGHFWNRFAIDCA